MPRPERPWPSKTGAPLNYGASRCKPDQQRVKLRPLLPFGCFYGHDDSRTSPRVRTTRAAARAAAPRVRHTMLDVCRLWLPMPLCGYIRHARTPGPISACWVDFAVPFFTAAATLFAWQAALGGKRTRHPRLHPLANDADLRAVSGLERHLSGIQGSQGTVASRANQTIFPTST